MTEIIPPPRRILVVDDEPLVCDAVKMLLAFDGHSVQTATNAADALTLFGREKFDLVMPGMRGDQLAAAIKARDPKQPVVMITAHAEMLPGGPSPPEGVDVLISKPFLLQHLRDAITKTLPSAQP